MVRTGGKWSIVSSAAVVHTVGRGDNKQNALYGIRDNIWRVCCFLHLFIGGGGLVGGDKPTWSASRMFILSIPT